MSVCANKLVIDNNYYTLTELVVVSTAETSFLCLRRLHAARKSKWCRVISWSVIVVSRSFWPLLSVFFVISRSSWSVVLIVVVSRRGQSSWSVVFRGWCLYSMVVMFTYLLRHTAGENLGQCLDKCTGWVGRTRVVVTKLDRNRSRMSIIT